MKKRSRGRRCPSKRFALHKAFGVDEHGFPLIPVRYSNLRLTRLEFGENAGCSRGFPHGFEVYNARELKETRSWKRHRRTQYRPKDSLKGTLSREEQRNQSTTESSSPKGGCGDHRNDDAGGCHRSLRG